MDFTGFPLWGNAALLAGAGLVVWLAGGRLARNAERIGVATGMSEALAGALLLGVATSLPEIATTVSAGLLGNASLAVNNLFGGVAMQMAVLAVIDFWLVKGALTYFSPDSTLLLGGVLLILQVAVSIVAVAAGDVAILGHVGAWPFVLAALYVLSLYFMDRYAKRDVWTPKALPDGASDRGGSSFGEAVPERDGSEANARGDEANGDEPSLLWAGVQFAAAAGFVLVGGWVVASASDALSEQTGLSGGFVGATLVALTTSLPEISTTAAAVRAGNHTMAIANIFGTNTLEIALLLPSDLTYTAGPIVDAVDRSALLMAGLSVVLTAIYLWGLLERRNRTVFNLGLDSAWALGAYVVGLVLLYLGSDSPG
ncbi:sodium:calcium antiporter [Alienimonas californiensis]|uniref:Putative calcium/sodium:proton antiporter n=1 Tax=Alienimonas californiensis TaxID=2527989 RepID=A0A517PA24_9PLAN|nr:sodium:calcium antiporter [Alienimonas californiensis]QDT16218.1 putative calcium/sodium:proton antiporter [Alienimonas californiensis]